MLLTIEEGHMSISGCKGPTLVPALGCGAVGVIAFLSRKIVPQWASKPLLLTATALTGWGCYASIASYLKPADPLKNYNKHLEPLDYSYTGQGVPLEFSLKYEDGSIRSVKAKDDLRFEQLKLTLETTTKQHMEFFLNNTPIHTDKSLANNNIKDGMVVHVKRLSFDKFFDLNKINLCHIGAYGERIEFNLFDVKSRRKLEVTAMNQSNFSDLGIPFQDKMQFNISDQPPFKDLNVSLKDLGIDKGTTIFVKDLDIKRRSTNVVDPKKAPSNAKKPISYEDLINLEELDLSHLGESGKVIEFWFEFQNGHRTLVKVQEGVKVNQLLGAVQGVRFISAGKLWSPEDNRPIKDVQMLIDTRDGKTIGRMFALPIK
ncbi:MAG: hypothetical protein JSR80_07295 [Verrucomicrobia bacterium]|nr:hypothetical protein [Verrucomicrobiota bacterium]